MSEAIQQSSSEPGDCERETSSTISFQDGITNLLMESEELRLMLHELGVVTNDDCFQILHDVEGLLGRLYSPQLKVELDINHNNEIEIEMRNHCLQKTTNVAMQALRLVVTKKEPDLEDEEYRVDEEKDCQSAIARVAELNLVLCCDGDAEGKQEMTKKNVDEVIKVYSSYQRQVLRQRAKPSIARSCGLSKKTKTDERDNFKYQRRRRRRYSIIAKTTYSSPDDHTRSSYRSNSPINDVEIKLVTSFGVI